MSRITAEHVGRTIMIRPTESSARHSKGIPARIDAVGPRSVSLALMPDTEYEAQFYVWLNRWQVVPSEHEVLVEKMKSAGIGAVLSTEHDHYVKIGLDAWVWTEHPECIYYSHDDCFEGVGARLETEGWK